MPEVTVLDEFALDLLTDLHEDAEFSDFSNLDFFIEEDSSNE